MPEDSPAPSALELADALVSAGTHGTLSDRPVADWLHRLRQLQDASGHALHGCFNAPAEVSTLNAPTFTSAVGLRLLVVRIGFAESLDADSMVQADEILADLESWVLRSRVDVRRYSPSRTLGDLVCGWLIAESQSRGDMARLKDALTDVLEYCLVRRWGNGEHLGDRSATHCLDALSVLLLLGKSLPDQLRTRCATLLGSLLAIDDAYGPLPRVPDLGFDPTAATRTSSYRARILGPDREGALANFLRQAGWEAIIEPPSPSPREIEAKCFGNVMARAHLEPDSRLGSLERFPLMPSSERRSSGLSWHSHPVVFRRNEGDCGFFQWETQEGENVSRHPGILPCALTSAIDPPIVGRTFAVQKGPDAIILRILPAIAQTWDHVVDRFRVSHCRAQSSADGHTARWRLQLHYPDRIIAISRFDLPGTPLPTLAEDGNGDLLWDLHYDRNAMAGRRLIVHLWAISLVRGSAWPPAIVPCFDSDIPRAPEETAFDFRWKSGVQNWHLLIDPLKSRPLTQL